MGQNEELNKEEYESEYDPIYLSDEDGNQLGFQMLTSEFYEGEEYALLLPIDEDGDSVVIMKLVPDPEDEDMVNFETVEDDQVLYAVYDIFKEALKDDFDLE